VRAQLQQATRSGLFDEEFRIVREDGEVRWIWAKASPLQHSSGSIQKLVGTAQDITARKLAAAQVALHLAAAENARAEAEALRKATLALTQDLRMDAVLDTLLLCLREVVPFDSASVVLAEEDGRVFVARESPVAPEESPVVTVAWADNDFLERVLLAKKSIHLDDTHSADEWQNIKALSMVRCWIAVPLVVSDTVLGLLSIGSRTPKLFTPDHFRRAKSLAVPAAVAIHNARLYEWAQIYAAERQKLLGNQEAAPRGV